MTWEEDTLMESNRNRTRPRTATRADADAQRKRHERIRQFITVFGATHWAERIEARRTPIARRGHIAL